MRLQNNGSRQASGRDAAARPRPLPPAFPCRGNARRKNGTAPARRTAAPAGRHVPAPGLSTGNPRVRIQFDPRYTPFLQPGGKRPALPVKVHQGADACRDPTPPACPQTAPGIPGYCQCRSAARNLQSAGIFSTPFSRISASSRRFCFLPRVQFREPSADAHARRCSYPHHVQLAGVVRTPQRQHFQLAETHGAVKGVGPVVLRVVPFGHRLDLQVLAAGPAGMVPQGRQTAPGPRPAGGCRAARPSHTAQPPSGWWAAAPQ